MSKPTESEIRHGLERLFLKLNVRKNTQGALSRKGVLDNFIFVNGIAHNVEIKIDADDSLFKTQKDFIRRGWKNSYCLHFWSDEKIFDIYYYNYCMHQALYKGGVMVNGELYRFNMTIKIGD